MDPVTHSSDPYVRRLLARREAKDRHFAHSPHSPLPADRRGSFTGLAYYPPDAGFRLGGIVLEPVDDAGAPFLIATSDNRPRTAYRLGRLRFRLHGRDLSLTAYQIGATPSGTLFVPFTDGTSGSETYGAGRYLDLEAEPDGSYVLDFNEAYHPYCAYADTWSCPLPPAENRLPVRIAAGERLDVPGHTSPAA